VLVVVMVHLPVLQIHQVLAVVLVIQTYWEVQPQVLLSQEPLEQLQHQDGLMLEETHTILQVVPVAVVALVELDQQELDLGQIMVVVLEVLVFNFPQHLEILHQQ